MNDWMTLDRKQLEERFSKCGRLSELVERARCGLERAAEALSADEGPPRRKAAAKALAEVVKAAAELKTRFWVPEDRTAYAVEKAARDLAGRLRKGPLDPAAAKRAAASVKGTAAKVDAMVEARKRSACGITNYESVKVERKY